MINKMIKILLALFLLVLIVDVRAQNLIQGEGKFLAKDTDNLNFIKKQLLSSAFRDVVKKELEYMGLDAKQFFERLEIKYEAQYRDEFEKLKEKFDQNGDVPSRKKREDYLKALRIKELTTRENFENFNRLITSYSNQNITRSSRNPLLRFMKIEARVDRQALSQLYKQHMRTERMHKKMLYLSLYLDLHGGAFLDFGVDSEEKFKEVILNHWREQLYSKGQDSIQEIKIATPDEIISLENHLKKNNDVLGAEDHIFQNSMWLKFHFNLKKISEDLALEQKEIKIDGGMILLDLTYNNLVLSYDFQSDSHQYKINNQDVSLGMSLTNFIARRPTHDLVRLGAEMEKLGTPNFSENITVKGHFNILDVNNIIELLNNKGNEFELKAQLVNMGGLESKIKIEANGEKEKIFNLFRLLNGEQINSNKKLDNTEGDLLTFNVVETIKEISKE